MFTALIIHPLYQKYKPAYDDKNIIANQLAFPFEEVSARSNNYFLPTIRKATIETVSEG